MHDVVFSVAPLVEAEHVLVATHVDTEISDKRVKVNGLANLAIDLAVLPLDD